MGEKRFFLRFDAYLKNMFYFIIYSLTKVVWAHTRVRLYTVKNIFYYIILLFTFFRNRGA